MSDHVCYGKYSENKALCAKCSYHESCCYYTASEKRIDSRSRHCVSFERADFLCADLPDYDHIPGEVQTGSKSETIGQLAEFFRYLIGLDDYTLALICKVIDNHDAEALPTVKSLSRDLGCSRQSVHRKILDIIGKRPELSGFFREVMLKISRTKNRLWRRTPASGRA